jgi:hypothetical protein
VITAIPRNFFGGDSDEDDDDDDGHEAHFITCHEGPKRE